VRFVHPVSKQEIDVTAPVPEGNLWHSFQNDK
jgi:23S rRNA pseudouridine1911/1915/1917 synthase